MPFRNENKKVQKRPVLGKEVVTMLKGSTHKHWNKLKLRKTGSWQMFRPHGKTLVCCLRGFSIGEMSALH